jgi:hypothetical protein
MVNKNDKNEIKMVVSLNWIELRLCTSTCFITFKKGNRSNLF